MCKKIWKSIPGYEGKYEISNIGEVKSLIRKGKTYETILCQNKHSKGYMRTNLDCKSEYIHRLVAISFIPNPDNKKTVNHINGIKNDNRVENLEWCTNLENMKHGRSLGLFDNAKNGIKGETHGRAKLNNDDILTIRKNNEGLTQKQLSEKYKVTRMTISNIVNNKSWTHL